MISLSFFFLFSLNQKLERKQHSGAYTILSRDHIWLANSVSNNRYPVCLVYTFKCSLPLKDTGNSNVLVSFLVRLILPKPYALILIFALHHFIFPKREKRPLDHSVALPLADVNFQVYSNFCVSLDLYVCSSLVLR